MNSRIIAAVTLAATTIGLVATPAMARKPKLTGEAKLTKMLEGREAGKPTNCLPLGPTQESTIIDKTAIVYRYGGTLYVNRPSNAESLDSDDILLTRQTSGQLCRLDSVQLIDRTSRFYSGFVALQDFVPYKKVASAK
jgi:hypothetical protein